ncbi:MAG: sigma 54-interacting transcriptional regulator [Myxococcota bacterium]
MSQTRAADTRFVELPTLALLALSGQRRGDEIQVTGQRIAIGKAEGNDLVLVHDTVSRQHCEIIRDARGFLVRDLQSTNGTLLDGSAVREAYLRPGAVLTVGKVELKVRTVGERVEVLPSEAQHFGDAVGKSLSMRRVFGLLERLAPSDASILLDGETGTGKGLLARAIHAGSRRESGPFIVVDCASVIPNLIESELFGHERGAFSGATDRRLGAFELAAGGTLFLDEVGELPLDLQPKLLRVLQQRTFRRVGGQREQAVDVRVIAATKRNLRVDVQRGKFREDLYFRIAVATAHIPPLRERRPDVPLLVDTLLTRLANQDGAAPLTLDAGALAALAAHEWPGNVRELHNALARASILARSAGESTLRFRDLPATARLQTAPAEATGSDASAPMRFKAGQSYRDAKAAFEQDFEKRYVAWLLDVHEGNVSAAARAADMDRKYLHKLAKKHGLR